MGGGGSYYDRDVTVGGTRSSRGYSDFAEETMDRSSVNAAVLPKNRRIKSTNKSPLVLAVDGTGSMGTLPKIFVDKTPMVAGQLAMNKYLDDPAMRVAVVGDVVSDRGPIQIADFVEMRKLDDSL